jgi:hypothetical protein
MATRTERTGKAGTASGGMSQKKRDSLDARRFAFPQQRKEPLNDAAHVRNAISRFDQVEGVSDAQRDKAWGRIKKAAKKYGVEVSAKSWRSLGKTSKKSKKSKKRKKSSKDRRSG